MKRMKLEDNFVKPLITDLRDSKVRKGDLVFLKNNPELPSITIAVFNEFVGRNQAYFNPQRLIGLFPPKVSNGTLEEQHFNIGCGSIIHLPSANRSGIYIGPEMIARELVALHAYGMDAYISDLHLAAKCYRESSK